jgi:hypothetical protein
MDLRRNQRMMLAMTVTMYPNRKMEKTRKISMMDRGQATRGKTRKDEGKDITVRRVSQVDSLGTVSYISKGLYTYGSHTDHGLCIQ